ncbi:tRNA lysidine(34) synthetase TilS [Sulfurovum sp. bin170]|nr:tRNA lysidine(34) synthetase TilS [Sulfurovum sp. bin170]
MQDRKNLLAFSAGVDSSALFFLLQENNISFDIALINYGMRKQSEEEERYAIDLAQKYNLKSYITKAPSFSSNFEKNARDFRYSFFDKLMEEHNYENLITAHQLNDQLEWFLMRLTKGAGTSELLGLESISKRKEYTLIRPILHHSKDELMNYLDENGYRYFIDESNSDEKYERNYFRNNFSDKLIEKYKNGIQKSFEYLQIDKEVLLSGYREVFNHKELYILEIDNHMIISRVVDKYLKKLGYLLSSAQRAELANENSMVFGGLWAVEIVEDKIYIAPYLKEVMPKKFKEACRIAKIPSKVRGYYYHKRLEPKKVSQLY